MQQRISLAIVALGVVALLPVGADLQVGPASVFAPQPAGRGRGAGAPAQGGGGGEASAPVLVFREPWKLPYNPADITPANRDQIRRVAPGAVTNANLELNLYGADAKAILATEHEGRVDIWNGMAASPTAVTLRDKARYFDLTGRARLRWIIRANALHEVHPVLKLANGTLIVGEGVETGGEFVQMEVAFNTLRWYTLDPQKVVTTSAVPNPDLSRVDEIGWADLSPGGGHNSAGWVNVSHMELYGKAVPR